MYAVIATEGTGEFKTFAVLVSKISSTGNTAIRTKVLKVNCQPDGPPRLVSKAALPSLKIAEQLGAQAYLLVLDRESQENSPGDIANRLESELVNLGTWKFDIFVVIKDRTYENWLIADPSAFRKQPARYTVTNSFIKAVSPNKADRANAIKLLNSIANKKEFDKIADVVSIVENMDIDVAARNSRSLRHFLHVLQHPKYKSQCRLPSPAS